MLIFLNGRGAEADPAHHRAALTGRQVWTTLVHRVLCGSDRELMPSGFMSDLLVPSLHLASWNFTGGAKG